MESNEQSLAAENGTQPPRTLELLKEIELPVTLRFGRARMSLRDLSQLNADSVIELDRALTDHVEILISGHVVAKGEPVVVDGVYGIRIAEIVSRQERLMTTSLENPTSAGLE
jgi:flagellar motor switch protein FliN/FliY